MKLSEIALKYLKGQKKHTIMTVIAITVSVAFMTVMLSAISIYRASALNIAEKNNGTYHILFNGLNKDELLGIKNLSIFEKTETYSVSSYTSDTQASSLMYDNSDGRTEYLCRTGIPIDDAFLRIRPDGLTLTPDSFMKLTAGRYPEKDGEIVISDRSAIMWGYPEINSTVSADLVTCMKKGSGENIVTGENIPPELSAELDVVDCEEITFTVVGYSEGYNIVSYDDTRLRSISSHTDNLLARFNDTANDYYWDLHHAFKDMGYEIDDFSYSFNQELLDLEGKGTTAKFSQALFFAVMYLCVIFIMFCVRLVIDNSFEISARERIKQFGLLKAVGASKKQIFSLVLWEAFYLAVPGVILGILLGTACSAAAFSAIKSMSSMGDVSSEYDLSSMLEFDLRPYVFISSAVMGILWVCISAVATGLRSIKSSPVEAMRSAGKTQPVRIPRRPSKLAQGGSFIPAYSSLSIKRNRKRYGITMLSMVMSIVLFAGFSYGMDIAEQKADNEYNNVRRPYDYSVDYNAMNPYAAVYKGIEMTERGLFENVQADTSICLFASPAELGISPDCPAYNSSAMLMNIHPVNEATFAKFIRSDISYDSLMNSGKLLLVSSFKDENGDVAADAFTDPSASVSGAPVNLNTFEQLDTLTLSAAGLCTTDSTVYTSTYGSVNAVMAEEDFYTLFAEIGNDSTSYPLDDGQGGTENIYYRCITADAVKGKEAEAKAYLEMNFYNSFSDNAADMASAYALLRMVRLLGYFVIALISVIALINIANIISSNVLGRTSEFAMLRACGMTDKQMKSLILRESMLYALTASIISLALTVLAIAVIRLPFMMHFQDLTFDDIGFEPSFIAPLKYIVIAAAAAFAAAAASAAIPSSRIIKTSVVENIRNTEQV